MMNRLRFRFLDILVTAGLLIFLEAGAASAATVRQGVWELTLEKPVYQVGEPLMLSCRIPEQAGERWLGFVPVDFPRGAEYNQRSTRNEVSEIRTPNADCVDSSPLVAPQKPGRYQLRLGSGSDPAGPCLSIPFAVAPPRGALTLARTRFAPGEKIEVAYTLPAGSDRPSLVLVPPEVPHGAAEGIVPRQLAGQYLAVAAGRNTLVAPNRLGTFELRLLSSDRGVELDSVPVELALPAAGATYIPEEERIFSFASDITVHPDGKLTVSETIEVWSAQSEIRHGIYRDVPTIYRRDGALLPQVQGFEVVAAERDGQPEPYFIRRLANGVRIYLGDKETYVPSGRHAYRLTYRTDRQLGLFVDRDELYWNVTGNGWVFPMNRVTARVHLPSGARVTATDAFTGLQGAREKAFTVATAPDGGAAFATTQPLERNQGLTIVAAWPKGSIEPPGLVRRGLFLLRDLTQLPNRLLILGLLVALGYYLVVWYRHGRDPRVGIIVPRYAPPAGLCPAALRFYSRHERYDHQAFTAAVVSLAVKRFLTISQLEPGNYQLSKANPPTDAAPLPETEQAVMRMFDGADAVALGCYQSALSSASDSLKNHLQEQTGRLAWDDFPVAGLGAIAGQMNQSAGRFFKRNWRFLWPGALLSSVALFAGLFEHHRWATSSDSREIVGMAIAALLFTPFGGYLLVLCWRTWRSFLAAVKYSQLIGLLIGSALFVGGAAMPGALWVLMYQREPALTLLIFALLSTNLLFIWLLPAPTALGRQLLDQIEGFRRFLKATEEERLQLLHPPERTPELFERFLPHAIALGCANAWAEQFSGVIDASTLAPGRSDGWYADMTTGGRMSDVVGLSSALSTTVAGAISAAATAPGSSGGGSGDGGGGGGGGGGSSGGGGGGGGGGGW